MKGADKKDGGESEPGGKDDQSAGCAESAPITGGEESNMADGTPTETETAAPTPQPQSAPIDTMVTITFSRHFFILVVSCLKKTVVLS